MAYIGPNL